MENKKTKKEIMRAHIEACNSSGISVTNYCKENGLQKSAYYYWLKRLETGRAKSSFTQIMAFQGNQVPGAAVVINFPNGVTVSFNSSVETKALRELICCM